VGVIALAVYARTLAPTVTLVDSGELIVAAHGLGVAHPPGFPLYVLLGHVASAVPLGSVAQRVAALSAVCFAVAAALLTAVVSTLLARIAGMPGTIHSVAHLPLILGGVLLALSRTVWSYATVAEVYGLTVLALVGLLWLALRARSVGTPAALFLLAVVFGVALGTHLVMVALAAPALVALTWNVVRARPRLVLGLAAAAALATVAVYLYLPWAAARATFPNWGDPRTLERAWWHASGRQYQAYITPSSESVGEEALAFGRTLLHEFGSPWAPAGLALSGIGFVALWRRSRSLSLALALLIGFDLAYALVYTIAEDKAAYYLPSIVALCLAAGVGAGSALAGTRRKRMGALALLLLALIGPLVHARESDRSRFLIAHDYARDLLAGIGDDGLLLTSDWQVYSPLLYFQEIESWRADVLVVDVTLLRRSWYVDSMRARAPTRWEPLRAEADVFLEDLRAWERDPERYARSVSLTRRINDRFQTMVLALMTASKRVYVTGDVVLSGSPDPDLAARLTRTFSLTPRGLVFALDNAVAIRDRPVPDPSVSDLPVPDLQPRGLFDGTVQLADDDVARLKVQPVYLGMTVNRGHYLMARGDRERAAAAYRRALEWDPAYAPALDGLERLRAAR
jgi:hypothetical protein